MLAKDYNNEFLRQIRTVPQTVEHMSRVITNELFADTIPTNLLKKTRNVIITGAGDSYFAGIVARPTFQNIQTASSTGMVPGIPTEAVRVVEFTRYYDTYRRFWLDGKNDAVPLVLGVSISGSPARVIEAMMRTNKYNGVSVAFTNNVKSVFAQEAQFTIPLNVPPIEHCPAITSYISSCYALTQFGLYYSTVKGKMDQQEAAKQREAMLSYAAKYDSELMNKIEEQALEISKKWIDIGVENMDFIGDGPDYASAYFASAKMVESFGGLTTYDDSEEWNHINCFIRNVEKVGTFIIANEESPSFGRLIETANTAVKLGRPTVIVTDADRSKFPEKADVFTLPKSTYQWCNPIMQHIPMSYIAAFTGLLQNIPDFVPDSPVHQLDGTSAARFRKSKIEII